MVVGRWGGQMRVGRWWGVEGGGGGGDGVGRWSGGGGQMAVGR